MEIQSKSFWIRKFIFEEVPMQEISRRHCKLGDLLYEIPAETRLTVYRWLDIAKRARVGPRTQVVLAMTNMF